LSGQSIHLVTGTVENIKITQPMDLVIASKLLEN
jgi:2-C-methyl-D-erythritol 4-phosphate cytidylyltransferase